MTREFAWPIKNADHRPSSATIRHRALLTPLTKLETTYRDEDEENDEECRTIQVDTTAVLTEDTEDTPTLVMEETMLTPGVLSQFSLRVTSFSLILIISLMRL